MNKNKYYSGIDWMRLIAAVLVITIHTSPLASYNTTGDFTKTLCLFSFSADRDDL